jgi:hypothetical protein
MPTLQEGRLVTKNSVWPEPKPLNDQCMCFHGEAYHTGSVLGENAGSCFYTSYAHTCSCSRYRNRQLLLQQRREENFWAGVGNHAD